MLFSTGHFETGETYGEGIPVGIVFVLVLIGGTAVSGLVCFILKWWETRQSTEEDANDDLECQRTRSDHDTFNMSPNHAYSILKPEKMTEHKWKPKSKMKPLTQCVTTDSQQCLLNDI